MKILSDVLKKPVTKVTNQKESVLLMKKLGLKMLRIEQAIWHQKKKVIILFEGFDASGKGTCIRHLTEGLDPRSLKVYAIGAPNPIEKEEHYLARFFTKLPRPGYISLFDRSWYGRLLVEKIEKLSPKTRIEDAYEEINQFEKMLTQDGIILIKIFLAVSKVEQLKRFYDRLDDPYKNWKLTEDDIRNRKSWDKYVLASDQLIKKCSKVPWQLISSDSKEYARLEVLKIVTNQLSNQLDLFEKNFDEKRIKKIKKELDCL